MGTWGAGSFENDDALDFLDELTAGADLGLVADAFQAVFDDEAFIEADEAQIAVAAGEVVAWLRGASGDSVPDELVDWRQTHAVTVDAGLVQRAVRAVEAVLHYSALRLLWEEGAGLLEWEAAMQDLLARLKGETA